MAQISVRIINQYKYKYHLVISASSDKQHEDALKSR